MPQSDIKALAADIDGSLNASSKAASIGVLYLQWEIFVAAVSRAEAACEPLVEPGSHSTHIEYSFIKS